MSPYGSIVHLRGTDHGADHKEDIMIRTFTAALAIAASAIAAPALASAAFAQAATLGAVHCHTAIHCVEGEYHHEEHRAEDHLRHEGHRLEHGHLF
jgi:hypothetical protein